MAIYAMRVFTDDGVEVLGVGDEDASTVGSHWNAIRASVEGNGEALKPFRDRKVSGRRLQTDSDEVARWAREHEVEFEDIYAA